LTFKKVPAYELQIGNFVKIEGHLNYSHVVDIFRNQKVKIIRVSLDNGRRELIQWDELVECEIMDHEF
jgi:hypothetical protein